MIRGRATRALAVLSATLLPTLPACFPYALPPGQVEVGMARYATGGKETILHVAAGVHSASVPGLVDKPMDFGIGYGADLFSAKEGETSKVRTHGLYGEASRFVLRQPAYRVSFGGRGEMLFGGGEIGWGALARGAAELYQEADRVPSAGNLCDIHGGSGALAAGVYVESGYERLPNGVQAWITTAGLTFRWPFAYGLLVWGCE